MAYVGTIDNCTHNCRRKVAQRSESYAHFGRFIKHCCPGGRFNCARLLVLSTAKNHAHHKVSFCSIWPSMITFHNSKTIYNNFKQGGELTMCMAINFVHSR